MANKVYASTTAITALWEKIKSLAGVPQLPYTEVEWVESNGKQIVYLDWKPGINTFGFAADFIIRNAFTTSVGEWDASTNINGYGSVFGTRNSSGVNDVQLTSYTASGTLRIGNSTSVSSGIKTDKSRQQISLIGASLTKADGTTVSVTRRDEVADKPCANMTIFAMHDGLRRSGSGNLIQPATVRIYSLKFYNGTDLAVDLIGAVRKSDGVTGLYDKVSQHFYPAPGMTYGSAVRDFGDKDSVLRITEKSAIKTFIYNLTDTRM